MDSIGSKELDFLRANLEVKCVRLQHVVELIQDFEVIPLKARTRLFDVMHQRAMLQHKQNIIEQVQSDRNVIKEITDAENSALLIESHLNDLFRQEHSSIYKVIRAVYKNLLIYSENASQYFSNTKPCKSSFETCHFYETDANAKRRLKTGQIDDVIRESQVGSAYQIGAKYSSVSQITQFQSLLNSEIIKINGFVNMARIYRDEVCLLLKDLFENESARNYNKNRKELYKSLSNFINLTFLFILDCYIERERLLSAINKLEAFTLDILEDDSDLEQTTSTLKDAENYFNKSGLPQTDIQRPKTFREHLRKRPKRLRPDGLGYIEPEVSSADLEKEFDMMLSNQVLLTIVGRRGAGKSSFINSIRNLRSFDEQAAQVKETECTMKFEFYPFVATKDEGDEPSPPSSTDTPVPEYDTASSMTSTSTDRVYLCDLPGVGTENFSNMNYEMLEADLFIYVFYPALDEIDYKVIKAIEESSAKSKLILVRNKVDMDLQDLAVDIEFDDIDDQEELNQLVGDLWPNMQIKLRERFLREDIDLDRFFEPERRFYFLSSNFSYRNLFDFDELLYDMLNKYISSESKQKALEQNIVTKFGPKYMKEQLKHTYSRLKSFWSH